MKKQTKHEKIIALYKEGMKPKDIAAKLKIKTQTVYAAKYSERKRIEKVRNEFLSGGVVRVIQPQINRYTTHIESVTNKTLDEMKKSQIVVSEPSQKTLLQKIKRFFFGV
jgi:DNA integrity scanning protein DisA with diadenylate cyclase activity